MIGAIALLFACELAGSFIRHLLGLPLPGSVLGMLVLLVWLAAWPRPRLTLDAVTAWLTAHLSIMFVPAAVGVIQQGPALMRYGIALGLATAFSTVLTLIVTVLVFRATVGWLDRRQARLRIPELAA